MLEAYAFLAVFAAQVVTLSALHPVWLIRRTRARVVLFLTSHSPRPGREDLGGFDRGLALYRGLNAINVVLGLVLLGWFFRYVRRPDWDDGPVEALVTAYFAAQVVPVCFWAWQAVRVRERLKRLVPQNERKATLRPRGLFDFVSPLAVTFAALSYFLFAAFVLYIERDPFPGFAGYRINLGMMTLVYALTAFCVYGALYATKVDPLQTASDRERTIEAVVKFCVYSCSAAALFMSVNFMLVLLDLQRWEPFAQSLFLLLWALSYSMALNAPPRGPQPEGGRALSAG